MTQFLIDTILLVSAHFDVVTKDNRLRPERSGLDRLAKVLVGHLGQDLVEIGLVRVVDESVVEGALRLVAEHAEDVLLVADRAHIRLEDACKQTNSQYI